MLYRVVCEHLQNLYGYTLKVVDAICQDYSAACATAHGRRRAQLFYVGNTLAAMLLQLIETSSTIQV